MKTRLAKVLLLIALGTIVQGCAAAIPLLPLLASVPTLLMSPMPSSSKSKDAKPIDNKPMTPDPEMQAAITSKSQTPGDRGVDIAQQDQVSFHPDAEGSIPMRVGAVDMVSDDKARSVGDIVTVNVIESMSSESKQGTTLSKTSAIDAGLPNLLSGTEWLSKHYPLLNTSNLVNSSSSNASAGTGDMSADDTFTATVSSIVVAVNPSGTLSIRGDRQVRVNGEDDTIRLSGVIRPEDLDSNNSISSALVANLQVSMVGSGQIRDQQGAGVGSRLFDWVWPF
jgi:flagellar L-ring protein precursor FlgH